MDRPIADYGLIGDAHGAALVGRDGSIDWCCLPHVDSPAILLRLLDRERGGFFRLAPSERVLDSARQYAAETNVLVTTFHTASGTVRVLDAFDVGNRHGHLVGDGPARTHSILRLAECMAGESEVELVCRITPDFARQTPVIAQYGPGVAAWRWDGGAVALGASCPVQLDGTVVHARARLRAGERLACVLADRLPVTADVDAVTERLVAVQRHWRAWAARCRYAGRYRTAVLRSALVLKLLTHEPTGAIVAAPTTSLPEAIGGERNWDYRYCWLRDATFTLHALEMLGYLDEAHAFMHWIQRVCMACGVDLQIMYGVGGERDLREETLAHLRGYRDSRPVRIGNAAHRQRQLDVFGEVLDSAYLFFHGMHGADRFGETLSGPMWGLLVSLVDHVAANWRDRDNGIWEVRGQPRHFLHSKLLCWVALDRGIKLAEAYGLPAALGVWRSERRQLRRIILQRGYSRRARAFTQAFGSDAIDASALVMPLVGFIGARDPRMQETIDAVRGELLENGMVLRYRAGDGLPGREGAFSICTFWLVDCLALAGRLDEARALFEGMLQRGNELGLYSEEIDPATGQFLGNFPQGFTHIALIRSALSLEVAEEVSSKHLTVR